MKDALLIDFQIIYCNIVIVNYTERGTPKTEHFSDRQNQIAILTKALGHPARVAIIEYLMQVNECICGDIINELAYG